MSSYASTGEEERWSFDRYFGGGDGLRLRDNLEGLEGAALMAFMSPSNVLMKSDSCSSVLAGRYEVIEAGVTVGGGALGFPRGLSSLAYFLWADWWLQSLGERR